MIKLSMKTKSVKLVKCPECRNAWYVKKVSKGKIKCPYCEIYVVVIKAKPPKFLNKAKYNYVKILHEGEDYILVRYGKAIEGNQIGKYNNEYEISGVAMRIIKTLLKKIANDYENN